MGHSRGRLRATVNPSPATVQCRACRRDLRLVEPRHARCIRWRGRPTHPQVPLPPLVRVGELAPVSRVLHQDADEGARCLGIGQPTIVPRSTARYSDFFARHRMRAHQCVGVHRLASSAPASRFFLRSVQAKPSVPRE